MHGLKCAGAFAGWTRLCDEWLVGLDRAADGGSIPWERAELAIGTVADAAYRTRRFARAADEAVPPIAPDAEGVLRFELQGITYVVRAALWSPSADDDALVPGADARLRELLPEALSAASSDEHPVALLVLAPRLAAGAEGDRRAFVEGLVQAFRDASITHAMAYAFPPRPGGPDGRYASDEHPGALLLARSGVFG